MFCCVYSQKVVNEMSYISIFNLKDHGQEVLQFKVNVVVNSPNGKSGQQRNV